MAENKTNQNKTRQTAVDPTAFLASIEHPVRRADGEVLLDLLTRVTGCPARMWGPTIIGFGRYHYRYASGREGESMIVGFSPRKAHQVLYILPGYDDLGDELAALGKYRIGKSCLYVNKLADIDLAVLEDIVRDSVATMRANHDTWDE